MRRARYGLAHVLLALVFLALIAFAVVMIFRPAAIIGVHADPLAHSLRSEIGGAEDAGGCVEWREGAWRCTVSDGGKGDAATYRVTTHDRGCWDATRTAAGDFGGAPRQASGCISLLDVVRVL